MKLILGLLALAILTANTMAAITPLHHVFDISMTNDAWSCKNMYTTQDANAGINLWWKQINMLNDAAIASVKSAKYAASDSGDTRKMARTMFGIMEGPNGQVPDPRTQRDDSMRYQHMRTWYQEMKTLLRKADNTAKKPKIFCDSSYLQYQTDEMPAIDPSTGQKRPKDPKNSAAGYKTLKEYETEKHGLSYYEKHTYFYYDVPNQSGSRERSYVIYSKDVDQDGQGLIGTDSNNRPSICNGKNLGWTLPAPKQPSDIELQKSGHIILCTETIKGQGRGPGFDGGRVPAGQHATIDMMAGDFVTFYHELFHLEHGDIKSNNVSPDAPSLYNKAKTRASPGWPEDRDAWAADLSAQSTTALVAMRVALYDRCTKGKTTDFGDPWLTGIVKFWAVHAPDNYVWFAIGNHLQIQTNHQWSSGYIAEKNAAWVDMPPPIVS